MPCMGSGSRIDLTNQFLIAMPGMADDTFRGAVVYLCEHNDNGALVQHEAALGLHRSAEVNGLLGQLLAVQRELDLAKQLAQRDVEGPVDDQAQGAVLRVLAQVDDGAGEVVVVTHARHGDQELVGEIDRRAGGHGIILCVGLRAERGQQPETMSATGRCQALVPACESRKVVQ